MTTKIKKEISNFILNLITNIYKKIFHEQISKGHIHFIRNIFYVGIGSIISTGLSFSFNILAGRILGPSIYGEYTLLRSIAMLLYIPMIMGISTALVKYNSGISDLKRQQMIISTSFILTSFSIIIFSFIYFLYIHEISKIFSTYNDLISAAIFFAILFAGNIFTTNVLRSLHKMKKFAMLRLVYGIVLLLSFIYFVYLDYYSYKSMLYPTYLANLIPSIIIIRTQRKYFKPKFDKMWAKKILTYSNLSFIGGISCVLYMNIDNILINHYMHVKDIGIYNAYYFASLNLVSVVTGIFTTVFFPTISQINDKRMILKQVNTIIGYVIFIGAPILFFAEYVILKLYGQEYQIDKLLMLIFNVTSILYIYNEIYVWFLNSVGLKGVKITLISALTIATSDIIFNVILIPIYGIYGAISATALAYFIGLCSLLSLWKIYKPSLENES
ncbi:MAG: oligosaccharide flippase family protein [Dysgonamonadaceae bacterium]|nr:oligosaccharide flippase family protein [Dysgonamonadaceae bacterium]